MSHPLDHDQPRIGVIAAAPAVDRFHRVAALQVGGINRPLEVVVRAGGKGFNVARAALTLGVEVVVAAPLAGESGRWMERTAREEGLDVRATPVPGEQRTCLSVASDADGSLTEFYEPPGPVSPDAWHRFVADALAAVQDLPGSDDPWPGVVLISGRLPPAAPDGGLAAIVGPLRDRGLILCLDSDGPGLRGALACRPSVVKVNASEAAALLGRPIDDVAAAREAADGLRSLGAGAAVVTLGRDGAVAVDGGGLGWRVPAPGVIGPYPVGSGDAFLAGLGVALARSVPFPDALRLAAGAAAANAEMPGAGVLDRHRAEMLAGDTVIARLS